MVTVPLPTFNQGDLATFQNANFPSGSTTTSQQPTQPAPSQPASPPPAPPPADSSTPTPSSAADSSAKALITSTLDQYGLGSLASWAWAKWQNGEGVDQIMLELRDTPEYKTRFPAMDTLSKEGRAISEATYIDYERSAHQMWTQAGLPPDMLDQGGYVTKWLEGDVSAQEISHRIDDLYVQVANAAPEVRQWFQQHFGLSGNAALAAAFADPTTATPVLERQAAMAVFGGTGAEFGYSIGDQEAQRAAAAGVSASQAQTGFGQLQGMNPLFNETISENQDLTAETTGVEAVFGLGGDAQQVLAQRASEREAAFKGSTNAGGIVTQQGFGLGTSTPNNG